MSLSIRAKSVIKLQSETVNLDLTMPKGQSLPAFIGVIFRLSSDLEELDAIDRMLIAHREKVVESLNSGMKSR